MEENIYPNLRDHMSVGHDQTHRLNKINEIQKELKAENESRAVNYKKYSRALQIIDGMDGLFLVGSVTVLGVGAAGVVTNVVSLPVAGVMAGLGVLGKFATRKLRQKAKKHRDIMLIAESKLNTIMDHVMKATKDEHISDVEFKLVLDEMEKYNKLKSEIRSKRRHRKSQPVMDDDLKNALLGLVQSISK